jgi:hypothetical protein
MKNHRTKPFKTRKAQFSVGLPGPTLDRLNQLARDEGISRSEYAADVLTKHLSKQGAKAAA